MKLEWETRMTIPVLARHGQSGRAIARMLGVDESTVRYHLQRQQTRQRRSRQSGSFASSPPLARTWISSSLGGSTRTARGIFV
jgi:IS30 family transposase